VGVQVVALSLRHVGIHDAASQSVFRPRWPQRSRFQRGTDTVRHSDEELEWRHATVSRWSKNHTCFFREPPFGTEVPACRPLSRVSDESSSVPRVQLMFHAVPSRDVALRVFREGFATLATTDDGYFGQGLYFSNDVEVRTVASASLYVL
jgi:hypothetical protein